MKTRLLPILFFAKCLAAQDSFQLAPPLLFYENRFFEEKTETTARFEMAGAAVRFTLDGSEPTASSPVFDRPVLVEKSGTWLRARVFADAFLPSEAVSAQFFKKGLPKKLAAQTPPDPRFPGPGPQALADGRAALAPAMSDPAWQGFRTDSVELHFVFEKEERPSQLALDVLLGQSGWIFLPERVAVFSKKPGSIGQQPLAEKTFDAAATDPQASFKTLLIDLPPTTATEVLVKIWPLARIPDWHPGRGERGWLFIDEAAFY